MTSEDVPVRPLRPVIADDVVAELKDRLARARLSGTIGDGWNAGTPGPWLSELVDDWREHEIAAFQDRLDGLSHFSADVDGQQLHFVHHRGKGPDPFPLILSHGWPGSFLEFTYLLPLLTDPAAHSGDARDAFDVVVPSLPGFGFSAPAPAGGMIAATMAELWHRLMSDGLGYRRYAAHGTDIGVGLTAWLSRAHPDAIVGIHLATPAPAPPPQPWNPAIVEYFAEFDTWTKEHGAYAHEHSTKPATLAAGLLDSPVGLAAWIGEKVSAWTSMASDGQPKFPRTLLLDTLTLYWATGTIGTSLLPYWIYQHRPNTALPIGQPSPVPCAVSVFGGERIAFPKLPRELAELYYNVTTWSKHDRGGHFPAVSEPQLLAETLRDVFRPSRISS
jgi:pimeloyl-ACP methyl ester carboxylesterase